MDISSPTPSDDHQTASLGGVTQSDVQGGERVDVPLENDVLCGRGGSINSHKGNEFFRQLVEKRKRVYLTARFKREKRLIASSIVSEIRHMDPPGRFLARKGGKDTGFWYDIGDEKARDKTSQALRENAPSIRAEIETEINHQREEMKRKEDEETAQKQPPPHYPPPPPGYYAAAQHYWDYYFRYYGYAHPPPPPPHYGHPPVPPPPGTHAAPPHPPPPPGSHPTPPPPPGSLPPPGAHPAHATSHPPPPHTPSAHPPLPPHAAHSAHVAAAAAAVAAPPPAPAPAPTPPPAVAHAPAPAGYPWPVPSSSAVAAAPTVGDRDDSQEEFKEDFNDEMSHQISQCTSQEEDDRRLAMSLQFEERVEAFEARKRRYASGNRSARSSAYCSPGFFPPARRDGEQRDYRPSVNHGKMSIHHGINSSKATAAMNPDQAPMDVMAEAPPRKPGMTQEEHDHRLAMALQEEEAKAIRYRNQGTGAAQSRRTSRPSNAVPSSSQAKRTSHREPSTSSDGPSGSAFENLIPNWWNKGASSFSEADKSKSERKRRSVQFKDNFDSSFGASAAAPDGTIIPPPADYNNRDMSPLNLARQNSLGSIDANEMQPRPYSAMDDTGNSSLLSQVATHILGSMGSWDASTSNAGGISEEQVPLRARHRPNAAHGTKKDQFNHNQQMHQSMDTDGGHEVALMEVRDETSMPPPEPRVQIDWPSRVGSSCNSWMIPESMEGAYHLFTAQQQQQQQQNTLGSISRTNSQSGMGMQPGLSPSNSLEMDMSAGHMSAGGSVGGGSLCNVFENGGNQNAAEEIVHRALLQVPSWERHVRGKSPLAMGDSGDDTDDSLVRVREMKTEINATLAPIQDNGDMDMEWEG